VRFALNLFEIAILSALVFTTRCANYQDAFVGRNIYFTDADCYARMTRVRPCAAHPGLILRHHSFENFPQGITPHTTVPLDYLILALSISLRPFTAQPLDLAGALISPALALVGAWFLWWWSRRMKFRYRWAMLVLYAISPILVHGTELGRPDHQSLLLLLVTVAICGEWTLRDEAADTAAAIDPSPWSVVSGIAWALAIWVSFYEPLLLLLLVITYSAVARLIPGALQDRPSLFSKQRYAGWICFVLIIALALLVERRIPSLSIFYSGVIFKNWSHTIGELLPVSPLNRIWFRWAGYMIAVAPFLIWSIMRKRNGGRPGSEPDWHFRAAPLILVLLAATYLLTIWQARWAYFFVLIFVIALPSLLEPIKSRVAVWIAFALSIFPILRDWDERLWPNEFELARQVEHRRESAELRDLAAMIQSSEVHPFLAPWWLSPAIAYWSRQPGVAGSSHESLDGIAESAQFFLSEDSEKAREILENRKIDWVLAYDADRVGQNSAVILGEPAAKHALCYILDRRPAQAPSYLIFSAQNGTAKLFRVTPVSNKR